MDFYSRHEGITHNAASLLIVRSERRIHTTSPFRIERHKTHFSHIATIDAGSIKDTTLFLRLLQGLLCLVEGEAVHVLLSLDCAEAVFFLIGHCFSPVCVVVGDTIYIQYPTTVRKEKKHTHPIFFPQGVDNGGENRGSAWRGNQPNHRQQRQGRPVAPSISGTPCPPLGEQGRRWDWRGPTNSPGAIKCRSPRSAGSSRFLLAMVRPPAPQRRDRIRPPRPRRHGACGVGMLAERGPVESYDGLRESRPANPLRGPLTALVLHGSPWSGPGPRPPSARGPPARPGLSPP